MKGGRVGHLFNFITHSFMSSRTLN